MNFNNIIYPLCDILVYYYCKYRNKKPNKKAYERMLWVLSLMIDQYTYSNDPIESISVTFDSFEYITFNTFNQETIDDIKIAISNYINNTDNRIMMRFSISLLVCPFEGLDISHSMIINNLDMVYY